MIFSPLLGILLCLIFLIVFKKNFQVSEFLYKQFLQKEVVKKTKKLRIKNEELIRSYQELQEEGKAKDEFLSIASHELRTPMTVINGFTEFLLSEKFGTINPKQRKFLNTVSKNTVELINLVNKMLDINKLEADKMEFISREIYFPNFLKELTREFKVMCLKKEIQLSFHNPEKIKLFIKSDPFKLKQVLTNLVRNSYKFTPTKGRIKIILRNCPQNINFLQISVCDNGQGISPFQQKMIFEKFHQIGDYLHKSYTGTGLGLSIVKLIIEKLGGAISVKSQENSGACFIFTIPKTR
jgi:signal transduction histidine kinase